ncbi:NAD(P)H-quinone oxidoreductase subunit I [mine drainage metagenome]|uniref:NAD(P)H-quinone oxidoreductase subunit I n=1 Tax=mine drainage metagenome TaxID=410659 RepID=A0A1J5SBH2_9ZZZZ
MTGVTDRGIAPLLIDEAACINIRGRVKTCAACQDACAGKALSLSLQGVSLDATRCAACGACVPQCPAGTMRLRGFSPRSFLQSLDRQPTVQLHCSACCADGSSVAVPCHSVLDARLLATAYAAGTVSFRLHGLDQCGHCPKGSAANQMSIIRETLRAWFAERAPEVLSAPENSNEERREEQLIQSRRGFLRGAGLRATAGAAAWLSPAQKAQDLESDSLPPSRAELEQQRPANYQALLLERVADLPWRRLPWRQRSITAACNACLVCAQRCPTGALAARSTPTARGIDFDLGLCTSCRLCERLCPEQAIHEGESASVSDVVNGRIPLVSRPVATCTVCQRTYVPGANADGSCPACDKERSLKTQWLSLVGRP